MFRPSLIAPLITLTMLGWQTQPGLAWQADSPPLKTNPSQNGVLILDGEPMIFQGIPQSTIDGWGPDKIESFRLMRVERTLTTSDYKPSVALGLRGQLQASLSPKRRYLGLTPLVKFLAHANTQDDLLFSPTQVRAIQSINQQLSKSIRQFEKATRFDAKSTWTQKDRQAAVRHFLDSNKKTAREINDFLLPHQQERLRQLVVQNKAAESGLPAMVLLDSFNLKLSDAQVATIRQQIKKQLDVLTPQIDELRTRTIAKLAGCLTANQRKILQEELGMPLEQVDVPLGILWAQLKEHPGIPASDLSEPLGYLRALTLPEFFELDECNQFIVPTDPPAEVYSYASCFQLATMLGGRNLRREWNMDFIDELRLSDTQVNLFQSRFKELDSILQRRFDGSEMNQPGSPDEKQRKQASQSAYERFARQHFEDLDEDQVTQLKQILERIELQRIGHLNILLHTEFRDRLNISESQRKELLKTAKLMRQILVEQSKQLEATFVERAILRHLNSQQKIQLELALGDYPKNTMRNLDWLVLTCKMLLEDAHTSHFRQLDLETSLKWIRRDIERSN